MPPLFMAKAFVFSLLLLFLYAGPSLAASPSDPANLQASPPDYRLGVGDLVRVQVHDEPDLTLQTRLSEKGTITYPFIGEFSVVGLSVSQLQDRIAGGLRGDYLVDPVVEYRPFYVNGQVKRPGGYPFVPGLTVRKAAAIAGGFTERASTSKLYLYREDADTERYKVSLDEPLRPGDTLVVEEGLF